MIVYKVTNLVNNKIYIGKTVKLLKYRKKEHLSDVKRKANKSIFHNAIRKYGEENFVWEIIDRVLFSESLVALEKHYIKLFNSKAPNGYNLTDGGDGCSGFKRSDESKAKMSVAVKGNRNHNFGKPAWNRGKKASELSCKKMSAAKLGKPAWNRGKKMSEYHCKKNSISHRKELEVIQ